MEEFSTKCVHAGTIKDEIHQGINSPVYTSTSYAFIDRDETIYPRYLNTPNERSVAEKIAALEETEAALVFSSGMAAITAVILGLLGSGDHLVFQRGLYGGRRNSSILKPPPTHCSVSPTWAQWQKRPSQPGSLLLQTIPLRVRSTSSRQNMASTSSYTAQPNTLADIVIFAQVQ
jgi:hypothetical protein